MIRSSDPSARPASVLDDLPAFRRPELLEQALTHSSYANERRTDDNERLEFLGDAVLQLCSTLLLMERFPEAGEGELTRLRQLLVSETALAALARDLGVGAELRLGVGEAAQGGREKPGVLADALEAVLGAVFTDRGFASARALARKWLRQRLASLELERAEPARDLRHPKNRLQERTQRERGLQPVYVYTQQGPDHDRTFFVEVRVADEVLARASGRSKTEAASRAAEAALSATSGR